jgi:hypothetical protein
MWYSRRLTILWTSTSCYRDSFTFCFTGTTWHYLSIIILYYSKLSIILLQLIRMSDIYFYLYLSALRASLIFLFIIVQSFCLLGLLLLRYSGLSLNLYYSPSNYSGLARVCRIPVCETNCLASFSMEWRISVSISVGIQTSIQGSPFRISSELNAMLTKVPRDVT